MKISLDSRVSFLVLLLFCLSFDTLSIPYIRLTFGELLLFFFLVFIGRQSIFLRIPKFVWVSSAVIVLLLLHHIAGSILFGLPFTFYKILRPILYLFIAGAIYNCFMYLKLLRRDVSAGLRCYLLAYSLLVIMQSFLPFLRLPIYNPSFAFNSLIGQAHATGLTVEPSFMGGALVTFYCLYSFVAVRADYLCLATIFLALAASGSRSGFVIIILFFAARYMLSSVSWLRGALVARLSLNPQRFLAVLLLSIIAIGSLSIFLIYFSSDVRFIGRLTSVSRYFETGPSSADLSVYQRFESQRVYFLALTHSFSFSEALPSFGYGFFRSSSYIPFSSYDSSYSLFFDELLPLNLFTQVLAETGVLFLVIFSPLIVCIVRLRPLSLFPLFGLLAFSLTCNTLNFIWAFGAVSIWAYCYRCRYLERSV